MMPPIAPDINIKRRETKNGNEKAHGIHVKDVTPVACMFVDSLRIKLISSLQAIVMAVSLNVFDRWNFIDSENEWFWGGKVVL
jgi:hypothetical protein